MHIFIYKNKQEKWCVYAIEQPTRTLTAMDYFSTIGSLVIDKDIPISNIIPLPTVSIKSGNEYLLTNLAKTITQECM